MEYIKVSCSSGSVADTSPSSSPKMAFSATVKVYSATSNEGASFTFVTVMATDAVSDRPPGSVVSTVSAYDEVVS